MNVNGIISSDIKNPDSVNARSTRNDFANVLENTMKKPELNLDSVFEAASRKFDVSEGLLKAVAKAESDFNKDATSPCGAMGIMQLMPGTAKSLGVTDAYDPEQNIMGGAEYLRRMLDEFGGDTELAVAAYNAGPGNVKKYSGIPPFAETQNYVKKVLGYCGSGLSAGSVPADSGLPSIFALSAPAGEIDADNLSCMLHMSMLKTQMQLFEIASKDDA